jgi:PST family polysaccharide transporter
MVTSVVGLATIVGDMGLSLAALQRNELTAGEKSNLFWMNVAVGIIVSVLVVLVAPLLGLLYRSDEVTQISYVLASTFFLSGASAQFRVEINRHHRFRTLAAIELSAQIVAFLVAVATALVGWGVWALVSQSVASVAVLTVLSVVCARWWPGLWSKHTPVGSFMRFGGNTFLLQALNYTASNMDNVVVGRNLGAEALGFYGRAFQLISLPIQQLVAPLTRVALPYLAQRRDSSLDGPAIRIQSAISVFMLGALGLLVAVIQPAVLVVLGPGWEPAASIMQILSIGSAFQCLGYVYYWLFLANARTSLLLLSELPGRIVLLIGVFIVWPWGVHAVAAIATLSQVIIWATGTFLFLRKLGVRWQGVTIAAARPAAVFLFATVATLAISLSTIGWDAWTRLATQTGAWILLAGGITLLWPSFRTQVSVAVGFLGKRNDQ